MADKKDIFDDVIDESFEDTFDNAEKVNVCPNCGAGLPLGAKTCPECGKKVENSQLVEEKIEEPKKGYIKPRPLAKGEQSEYVPTPKGYKYGDGEQHSASSLGLFALYGSWMFPIITLIASLIGLSSKNPKDVKLFKIAIVFSIVFIVAHALLIYFGIQQFYVD